MQAVTTDVIDVDAMHAEACKERDEAADLLYKAVLLLKAGQKGDDAFLERCRVALEKRDDRREAAGAPRNMPKRPTKATPARVPMSEVTKELGDPSTWEADDKDYADDLARRSGFPVVPERRKSVQSEQPDQNRRSAVQPPPAKPEDVLGSAAYRTWMSFPIGETVEGEGAAWERLSEEYRATWRAVADRVASIVRERAARTCEEDDGSNLGSTLARKIRGQLSPPGPGMNAASCLPTTLGEVWSGETRGQFVGSVVYPGTSHCFKCGKEPKEHTWPIVCPGEQTEVAKLLARIDEVQADGTKKHDRMVAAEAREKWRIYECDHWRTRAMLWRAALERLGHKAEEPKT